MLTDLEYPNGSALYRNIDINQKNLLKDTLAGTKYRTISGISNSEIYQLYNT